MPPGSLTVCLVDKINRNHQQPQTITGSSFLQDMTGTINILSKVLCSRPCRSYPRSNTSTPIHHKLVLQADTDCFATSKQQELSVSGGDTSLKVLNFSFAGTLADSSCFSHQLLHYLPREVGVIPKHPST